MMKRALYVIVCTLFLLSACSNKKSSNKEATNNPSDNSAVTQSKSTAMVSDTTQSGKVPAFSFAESEHDFGVINEGDVVSHVFKFTNTGDAPLIVESAKASCGCTVPNWPSHAIQPGEKGDIEVKFNSSGKSNKQRKTITITANTSPSVTRLMIYADVIPSGDQGPVKN